MRYINCEVHSHTTDISQYGREMVNWGMLRVVGGRGGTVVCVRRGGRRLLSLFIGQMLLTLISVVFHELINFCIEGRVTR